MSGAISPEHVVCSHPHKKIHQKRNKNLSKICWAKGKTIYPNMRLECQGGVTKCTHVIEVSGLSVYDRVTGSSPRIFLLFKTNNPKWCTSSTIIY